MCRKVYFCTAVAVSTHYRASNGHCSDKLVVHFADKKHTRKEKRMNKLTHICRVDSHLLWEPLYRKYLFGKIFFPNLAKNVFRNFFTIVIVDHRLATTCFAISWKFRQSTRVADNYRFQQFKFWDICRIKLTEDGRETMKTRKSSWILFSIKIK